MTFLKDTILNGNKRKGDDVSRYYYQVSHSGVFINTFSKLIRGMVSGGRYVRILKNKSVDDFELTSQRLFLK